MMGRALSADLLKIRRKGIWLLAIIAPIGLVAMMALNFGLRYDYLMNYYAEDPWGGLIDNVLGFVPFAIYLGITLVCSLMAAVEYKTSSWKQLLALPVSRTTVFSAKFTLVVIVLSLSCILLSIGTWGLGLALDMGWDAPYLDLLRLGFLPLIGALPMLALQLWLSITCRNPALPTSIGIVATVSLMFTFRAPSWLPLKWPELAYGGPNQAQILGLSLLLGIIIIGIGLNHFNRKDVA